jgi:hypothetical protein
MSTIANRQNDICYDVSVWQRQAVRHSRAFVKHVLPAFVKPAHTLWNEVIGFLFICLAVIIGFPTVKSFLHFQKAAPEESVNDLVRLALGIPGTLVLLYYGISSFLRARRISRS